MRVSLSTQQLVAVVLIVVLTAVNMMGLKLGKWIQNSFTFTKTAALLGLIVVGPELGTNRESAAWTSSWWNPSANGWDCRDGLARTSRWRAALALLALARPGHDRAAVLAVGLEQRDVHRRRDPEPGRTLPAAMILGTLVGGHALPAGERRLRRDARFAEIQHAPERPGRARP